MSNAAFTVKYRGNTFVVNRDGGVQRVFDDKISERLAPSAEFEAFIKGNQGARQRMIRVAEKIRTYGKEK